MRLVAQETSQPSPEDCIVGIEEDEEVRPNTYQCHLPTIEQVTFQSYGIDVPPELGRSISWDSEAALDDLFSKLAFVLPSIHGPSLMREVEGFSSATNIPSGIHIPVSHALLPSSASPILQVSMVLNCSKELGLKDPQTYWLPCPL